ncbi:MAG: hypothetical protein H0T62_06675 [Parachlamydiaceae bacterium]|nr:hypothetical protein [Parachlamydiaceae bacterium]
MIEKMIAQAKKYLPLQILEVVWDGTVFQMYGSTWNFNTLSAWRLSTKNKMIIGCFDKDSERLINCLKNVEILDVDLQTNFLKIDPVFILSNGQRLEIFSTDTYEPWIFKFSEIVYVPTPGEPGSFGHDVV